MQRGTAGRYRILLPKGVEEGHTGLSPHGWAWGAAVKEEAGRWVVEKMEVQFLKFLKQKVLCIVIFHSKYTRALTFENFCQDVVCRMQALHVSLGKVRSIDAPTNLGSNADEEGLPGNMWFEVVLSNGKKAAVRPAPCSDECLLGMDNEFQRLHVLGFVDMVRISPKSSI